MQIANKDIGIQLILDDANIGQELVNVHCVKMRLTHGIRRNNEINTDAGRVSGTVTRIRMQSLT